MPIISDIRPSRHPDRFSIYVDGTYVASINSMQISEYEITKGKLLDEFELSKLQELSDIRKALDSVYRYVSFRPRSERELRVYLSRHNYTDAAIESVLILAQERQLVDDAAFSRAWVADRALSGKSIMQIKVELSQKGIQGEVRDQALSQLNQGDEVETLCRIINRRNLHHRYPDRNSLVRHLSSKGFGYDNIKAALERLEIN